MCAGSSRRPDVRRHIAHRNLTSRPTSPLTRTNSFVVAIVVAEVLTKAYPFALT
jgi:hypothetical protein